MMNKTPAILLTVVVFASSAHAAQFDKPWSIERPRQTMLAAWQRLRSLEISGVATDMRFKITGESRFVGPEGDDGPHAEACVCGDRRRLRRVHAGEFFDRTDILRLGETRAAVLSGRIAAKQPERSHGSR